MELEKIPLGYEMTLLHLPGQRFRTGRLTGVFALPLTEDTAAGYALLPGLLTRRCDAYPTVAALSRRLDELYGAAVSGEVMRLGHWQILTFSVSFLEERYTLDGNAVAEDCCRLLLRMLFHPVLEDGVFRTADFAQEQRFLAERLQAEINDKRRYARHQCERLLAPGHPLSINPLGTQQTVAAQTPETAAAAWQRLLATARIHWLYQGDTDVTALAKILEAPFAKVIRQVSRLQPDTTFTVKESRRTEDMDLQQAKLVLGFRIAVTEPDAQVMAARLFTTLWGGCASSLLFRHVREEQSLCYYCAATYDRFNGVILVDSGIQPENGERVETEVLKQLEAIRRGDFSDEELEAARRSLIQRFTSLDDTPAAREGFYTGQTLTDVYLTPEETANRLLAVTREDVCRAAQLATLDSVYMLKPHEEVSA